jgi:formylglycine-generating enzyme required for sulfatase activity
LESWIQDDLSNYYLKGVISENIFGLHLVKGITSQDEGTRQFSALLITKALRDPRLKEFKVVQAFAEIGGRYGWNSLAWLNSNSSIEMKAEFIFAHYFSRPELFKDYMQNLKSGEKAEIEKYISGRTSFGVFEKFAKEQRIPGKVMKMAKPESFDFTALTFPKKGKKFSMGSPANEAGRFNNEFSEREVTITKSFEIAATSVTQLQWYLVMGENPSRFKDSNSSDGDFTDVHGGMNVNHPVETVSWNDVQQFIQKLNKQSDKYIYRLPTEAEWELAARAGTNTAYFFGDSVTELDGHGWYSNNSRNHTHAVAEKKPNALGLYDMYGNVWEWVQDYWAAPNSSPATDPTGPTAGSYRVLRGGGWNFDARYLRSAVRDGGSPDGRDGSFGFRLVRTLKK